jgi:ubiquinone/menaquinone biosynthesis C-methylase UbiE
MNTVTTYQPPNDFQEHYTLLRKKENRLYTNEQLAKLPEISKDHVHYKEWQIRKRSSEKLIHYLNKKKIPLQILEVGCGNGWLSAKLAGIKNAVVTGIDINMPELDQARKVFQKPNLRFVYGGPEIVSPGFDIIVFAASIQYFPSFENIINLALSLLNANGEIHILDTLFYDKKEAGNASARTKKYYHIMGCDEMSAYYFHRSREELKPFKYKIVSRGRSFINRAFGIQRPFPWIRIIKNHLVHRVIRMTHKITAINIIKSFFLFGEYG